MIDVEKILNLKTLEDFEENWKITKYLTSIIDSDSAREIVIHILDIWDQVNENAKPIWLDLIERAGFYPYYIDKIKSSKENISIQSRIRTEFFRSEVLPNVYFHEKQKEIERALSRGDNIAVSAPTSFGKSLLIEEMVARKCFDNILIIQPTLALIDETRKNLNKYSDYYNLVVNTKQSLSKKNIFILTAERVLEFLNFPDIDFFVIDEFYKISSMRKDSRVDALNIALVRIMQKDPQAMFLTPIVDSLSKEFRCRYNINFFKTNYSLVNTNIINVTNGKDKFYTKYSQQKKRKLFYHLKKQTEPSIVYTKTPAEAYKLAGEYLREIREERRNLNEHIDIYDWIDENISPRWKLKELLKYRIGVHNGALPRHIVTSEIDLFNSGKLDVLFATTSLIEGVNTVAKNMFIYSQYKGKSTPIDFFDFANIKGRAGRMNKYFTGNVYLFNEPPSNEEFIIDVPAVDQLQISDEILVNVPNDEVRDKERKKKLLNDIEPELQTIFRKNLVSIERQKSVYKNLVSDSNIDYLKWKNIPTWDELYRTIKIGCQITDENFNETSIKKITYLSLKLVNKPLSKVISEQVEYNLSKKMKDPENKAINEILRFQRLYARFKIPKLLAVVESIQKYIFKNRSDNDCGNYSVFASMLENERVPERLQFLVDYGVPSTAIIKLDLKIPKNIVDDKEITMFLLKNIDDFEVSLMNYEKRLLSEALLKNN